VAKTWVRTFDAGWTYELIDQVHLEIRHIYALRMVPFVASRDVNVGYQEAIDT